jgi:outer membrane protein TolC
MEKRMRRGIAITLACAALAGCDSSLRRAENFVSEQDLRTIQATSMQDLAGAQSTTQPATPRAVAPAEHLNLSVEEARQFALANNLLLRVELLNPAIASQSVSEERAQFESVFSNVVSYSTFDTPQERLRQGGGGTLVTGSQGSNLSVVPSVRVPLRTGGALTFDMPTLRSETDAQTYDAGLNASISHPLLRNAGQKAAEHGIVIATYQYQQSQARTRLEVTRVLAEVERVYWRLYAARRLLEVRKQEHDLAVAQLERARRRVAAQVDPEVEIVRAESGVADKLDAIIRAENQVRDRQRELKRILNAPGLELNSPTIIVPATEPRAQFYRLDPDRLADLAIRNRMEMLELELRIAQDTANVDLARNAALPLVNVEYVYGINGLGNSYADAFQMVGDKDFEDHRIGLRMEVPIGNQAARSRLRRSLASRMQSIATKEARIQTIKQEVFNAVDQLEAGYQQILATQKATVLAARLLDAEIRQYEQGLRTSTEVLDAQTKLANAQAAEIAAITEYQISQVDIAYAAGMVLGAAKVSWEPTAGPAR